MRSLALLALTLATTAVANPMPQAVPEGIAPTAPSPPGCNPDFDGTFQIHAVDISQSHRRSAEFGDLSRRQDDGALIIKLKDGVMHDALGRTGCIVANYQFQFDGPPQAGAIYTGGWSVCKNSTLALGGSTIFYKCRSGDFYNIYDRDWADQCHPIYIHVQPMSNPSSTSTAETTSTAAGSSSAESAASSSSTFVSSITNVTASLEPSSTPIAGGNGTVLLSGTAASSSAGTQSSASNSGSSPTAESTSSSRGGAVPTMAPGRELVAAAMGILGAVVML